jgi:cupin fold WbuC family metalloprotein
VTIHSSTFKVPVPLPSDPRACVGCLVGRVAPLLDLGRQPPSNGYRRAGAADTAAHPLRLGQCSNCALIQLEDPMPPDMVRSRFPWLTYNEPEGHLDQLAARIACLAGIDAGSSAMGLTYKDDTTLARLARCADLRTRRIDPRGELGIEAETPGLETLQAAFDGPRVAAIAARGGRVDLLIARHVLEHAHRPTAFLDAISRLVSADGYLVIEVPDSRKFLDAHDYSFVWEEHTTYFTPYSLAALLARAGLDVLEMIEYPYPYEDSLVAIARIRRSAIRHDRTAQIPVDEWARAAGFARAFDHSRRGLHNQLERLSADGIRIAMFGAGHLAAKFINFHGLAAHIACVIDDSPHKQGLVMPGSGIPIVSSGVLGDGQIDLCLSALSPESESKVLAKWPRLARDPSAFRSIFALSDRSIGAGLHDASQSGPGALPPGRGGLLAPPGLCEIGEDVFACTSSTPRFGRSDVLLLKVLARSSRRGRARICAHDSPDDAIQEMLIAVSGGGYLRPHRHLRKCESFHVVEGAADVALFDDRGNLADLITLGEPGTPDDFFCRIPAGMFHTVLPRTPLFVLHEVTRGPFIAGDAEFATFAPAEDDRDAARRYSAELQRQTVAFRVRPCTVSLELT